MIGQFYKHYIIRNLLNGYNIVKNAIEHFINKNKMKKKNYDLCCNMYYNLSTEYLTRRLQPNWLIDLRHSDRHELMIFKGMWTTYPSRRGKDNDTMAIYLALADFRKFCVYRLVLWNNFLFRNFLLKTFSLFDL